MLVLPTIILILSGISGTGGILLSAKSVADSLNASATTRAAQERNDRNLLRFQSVSNKLEETMEQLGRQRMVITKNFKAFTEAFEKIHNRPDFINVESGSIPSFRFEEIKSVSVLADQFLGAAAGALGGAALAAAATSGTTSAVMAIGTASTGIKIAELSGAAAAKAALAALGGGSLAVGGGGIALGTLVLNVASLGIGALIEGIAMAYSGSKVKKKANEMKQAVIDNEQIINDAIDLQLRIRKSAEDMNNAAGTLNNRVYVPNVKRLIELVNEKTDWNEYSKEEKLLVENNIRIVQLMHHLNNTPLYVVKSMNEKGEVEDVEDNAEGVAEAISLSKIQSFSEVE